MAKLFMLTSAISGLLAVALGAFGAHGFETILQPDLLDTYQTGVDYHFYHTLALLGVSILLMQNPGASTLRLSGLMFIAGTVVFSGSLYLLAISGVRWLGAITPIGGVAFIIGWAALLRFAWTLRPASESPS